MKIPKERYGKVDLLCQRHTQAEVAALFKVSQAAIWRITRRATEPERVRSAGKANA